MLAQGKVLLHANAPSLLIFFQLFNFDNSPNRMCRCCLYNTECNFEQTFPGWLFTRFLLKKPPAQTWFPVSWQPFFQYQILLTIRFLALESTIIHDPYPWITNKKSTKTLKFLSELNWNNSYIKVYAKKGINCIYSNLLQKWFHTHWKYFFTRMNA